MQNCSHGRTFYLADLQKAALLLAWKNFLGNGLKSFQRSARVIVMGRSNQLWSTWLPSKLLENYLGLLSSSRTLVPVMHRACKLKIDLRTSLLRNNRSFVHRQEFFRQIDGGANVALKPTHNILKMNKWCNTYSQIKAVAGLGIISKGAEISQVALNMIHRYRGDSNLSTGSAESLQVSVFSICQELQRSVIRSWIRPKILLPHSSISKSRWRTPRILMCRLPAR